MGVTPPPMPRRVTKESALREWNRAEAERELACYLLDKPYRYHPPEAGWFMPGVGYRVPPRGGSGVIKHR
jgi:hypothetical protein